MSPMRVSDYDYELPEERIALFPPKTRGTSRLLVLNSKSGAIEHRTYGDVADYLNPGDVVVLNNTKVIKARLVATNAEGKIRELLLLEDHHNTDFSRRKVLYRGKIRVGDKLLVKDTPVMVEDIQGEGIAEISSSVSLLDLAEHEGSVPLPPYIHREATPEDTKRYQTVFARQPGSVAAPTASLNFTHQLEKKLKDKGVQIAYLTLHVGLGTFLPIRSDDIEDHVMHSEYFQIPAQTVEILQNARLNGGKIVAVGTTVTRTLEFAAETILANPLQAFLGETSLSSDLDFSPRNGTSRAKSTVKAVSQEKIRSLSQEAESGRGSAPALTQLAGGSWAGEANIFIYPGYEFKLVDALLTNFHAPKSTVLMMAAARAGWPNLHNAYQEAIKEKYAFLSYGDSMLII